MNTRSHAKTSRSDAVESLRQACSRLYRTITVFANAAIVAAGYLRVQRRAKKLDTEAAAKLWDDQHRRSAVRLARLASGLRGMMVKAGQYMSARPDLLPVPYIEALAGLQDAVPPRPYGLVAARIERELGAPVDEIFERFERRPVASASLAQVHRAQLKDGRIVAVKVLYPGIEGIVRADLRNLRLIVTIVGKIWPRYDFRVIYREAQRLVPYELDLQHEAQNLQRIKADLVHRQDIVIPAIVPEASSAAVLTMEFLDGTQIGDVAALHAAGIDARAIAERLVDIFGDQVLAHGFFHGDPHPGNVLVLAGGRIGLIDFGQCLELAPDVQRGFALLSHSATIRDPQGMIRAIRMVGVRLPESDLASYLRMATQTLGIAQGGAEEDDQDGAAVNVRMARGFRGISLDGITGEALFVFRVQGLLRGLRARLGAPGNVIAAWNRYAEPMLADAPEEPDEKAS